MRLWHNDSSSVSTLEKKTLKIYHVLEDLNYGILKIYTEVWKKIRKKVLVGCQKNLVHLKIPYIARLTRGKSYKCCRSVPRELTPQQAQCRVDICRQLIGNPVDDRFIRIVTCV